MRQDAAGHLTRFEMDSLSIELQETPEELTLCLQGKVELSSVSLVKRCVDQLGSRRLVLDFTQGDIRSDAALGALVQTAPSRILTCRGLGAHHERLVHYLQMSPQLRS